MPLDRRITVRIAAEGMRNDQGEYVPGATTDYAVWSEQRGAGSVDSLTGAGERVTAVRSFTVRYFEALARARIDNVSVVDEHGFAWNSENVTLSDARRRFIEISALRAVN